MRSLLGLLCFVFSPAFASPDLQESILVRLQKDLKEFTVSGTSLSFGEGAERVRVPGVSRWRIGWNPRRLEWTVSPVSAAVGEKKLIKAKNLAIRGQVLRSSFSSFPDHLVLRSKGSSFDLIGDVDFRTYLSGVVSHEMPVSWPLETLKAQVIAARSYALAVRHERRKQPFHVESTIDDQVFRHVGVDAVARVRDAVKETDGRILTASNGKVLKAFYHADCGGRTARSSTVWGNGPDTGTVVDATCPSNPRSLWTFRLTTEDLMQRLKKNLGHSNLIGLALIPDRFDGRVGLVRMQTDDGDQDIKATDFRMMVGAQEIKSTRFEVTENKGVFIFKGRGFGHGVGLCQWGSKALGQKGLTADEILSHYYPKANLAPALEGRSAKVDAFPKGN